MGVKSILVTGGAGFLGRNLCRRLLDDGNEVVCVDNLATSSRDGLIDHPRYEFIRHDVTNPLVIEVDEIYNLACPASPPQYQKHPVQTTKTCVHGAINMLGLAKRLGVPILQASTSEVYGDPDVHPQPESYVGHVNPIGPRACYDEGKRCAETLFYDYHRQHGVDIRVARIFNTYGPGMAPDDGRVISNFIVQALTGEPITIYGTGGQTRAFCYVDDMVEGLVRLMASGETRPVNLGHPVETSIHSVAYRVGRIVGGTPGAIRLELPVNDPKQRLPNIERAREVLCWYPEIELVDGLIRTVDYFRRRIASDVDAVSRAGAGRGVKTPPA